MNEEFNIFKNLDDLRKTNLLDQLKSLESTKTVDLNDSQSLENDDFDFDSLISSNVKGSPTKRQQNNGNVKTVEKKLKKNSKSRRSSISSNGSISPTLDFMENLNKKVDDLPISRRTRRSIEEFNRIIEKEPILESVVPSTSKQKTRGKGRGGKRGGGRGRGRGRRGSRISSYENSLQNDSTENGESPKCISLNSSSNEALAHDDESLNYDSTVLNFMERFLQRGRLGRQRVMRGRRRCLAERAARSTQVDYIDLISSPMPRVEGFIDLDSDTEQPQRNTRSKKNQNDLSINSGTRIKSASESTVPSMDISFDEDNPELNIKINWKGKLETFKLRKHQKFSIIFEELAKRENISIDSIVFNLNDRIIMADDTPDSINYKIFHFIDGRVLLTRFNSSRAVAAASKKRDVNQITLKIQSDKWKRPLQINIMKTDTFRILYIKCAEELNVGVDQLKLSFDGELLEPNDTPTDIDLEGGEAIDLRIKN